MDKRERVERALAFGLPDRVPLADSFQHVGLIAHYCGIPERKDWSLKEICQAAGNALDLVQGWALSPSLRHGKITVDRHGVKWKQNSWFSWIVERPFSNTEEYAKALDKEIARLRLSSADYPEVTDELLMCKVADFRKTFLKYQRLIGDAVLMYPDVSPGLDDLYHLGGWEFFVDLLYSRPFLISEYLEVKTRLQVARAHAIADANLSPVVLVACDIAHKQGLLISPEFLRREYFPRVKQIVSAYHEHGMKVFYHSEGNLWQVLDDLINCGIDGLNPLEPDADMHAEELKKHYPRLVLWGGMDNVWLLPFGTPKQVEQRVSELIALGHKGGLFIGSTGQIHPGCKKKNCIAMIESVKRSVFIKN